MSRHALIVEDDEMLAELESAMLKRLGITSSTLHDGAHAAEWVKQNKPDLILLDLMLPGRSGYDICQELKLDRTTNLIPIIMATARSQHEDMLRGLQVGANYYLTKPFQLVQLEEAVRHVSNWRREMEQSGASGEVRFQIKSDKQSLEDLNNLVASLLNYSGLTDEQVFHLTTALREMGNNAIEWGNRNHIDSPVTVTYRIDTEKVTIVIKDQGSGFNQAELPHAVQDEDDPAAHLEVREEKGLRLGGFGIFMARKLVDELEYNETGNEVRLVKRFKAGAGKA